MIHRFYETTDLPFIPGGNSAMLDQFSAFCRIILRYAGRNFHLMDWNNSSPSNAIAFHRIKFLQVSYFLSCM